MKSLLKSKEICKFFKEYYYYYCLFFFGFVLFKESIQFVYGNKTTQQQKRIARIRKK